MPAKHNLSPASSANSYAASGVSIDAGNALVERIKPLAAATRRLGSMGGLGGFGGLFDLKACGYADPVLVAATDGVGTKLKLAFAANRHDTVGVDLVAMSVNDLVVQGAEPLFFLDYFACGALDVAQAEAVVSGVSLGCQQAGCQLIGGETAEMPGMYPAGEYDLAGFAVGVVERAAVLPHHDAMREGDVVLGLASSGVHSNGFALVRRVLQTAGYALDAPAPFVPERSLADVLLEPTRIYVKSLLPLVKQGLIKGMAHITGGGLSENIPRVLPAQLGCHIALDSWVLPPLFRWIQQVGAIEQTEMLRTFNCGIGMAVMVDAAQAQAVQTALTVVGEQVVVMGALTARGADAVTFAGEWA